MYTSLSKNKTEIGLGENITLILLPYFLNLYTLPQCIYLTLVILLFTFSECNKARVVISGDAVHWAKKSIGRTSHTIINVRRINH